MKKHRQEPRRRGLAPLAAAAASLAMLGSLAVGASSAQTGLEIASFGTSEVGPVPAHLPSAASDVTDEIVYVPLVSWTAPPRVLFADDFEAGIGNWTPYLNFTDLLPEQWYWDQGRSYEGSAGYTFAFWRGGLEPEDAISLYLGEGSEVWTDYRVSVRLTIRRGEKAGLWVRGTYRDQGYPGQWFEGYYCMVAPEDVDGDGYVQLLKVRTPDDPGDPVPKNEGDYHNFANPHELDASMIATPLVPQKWYQLTVEVKGPNIKCYVDDELAIDYTDTSDSGFLDGTIGLKVYGYPRNPAIAAFDDVLVETLP